MKTCSSEARSDDNLLFNRGAKMSINPSMPMGQMLNILQTSLDTQTYWQLIIVG